MMDFIDMKKKIQAMRVDILMNISIAHRAMISINIKVKMKVNQVE